MDERLMDFSVQEFLLAIDFFFTLIGNLLSLLFSNWLLASFTVLAILGFLLPFVIRAFSDNK